MNINKKYAVITGDIVKSSSLGTDRLNFLEVVKNTLIQAMNLKTNDHEQILSSGIFRGDSFQVLISEYHKALRVALFIQANIIAKGTELGNGVRMAIGIGKVETVNTQAIAESYGEAFLLSGRSLDRIESYRRLIIQSPQDELNIHLGTQAACLDAIAKHWTVEQAEAITLWLQGYTQQNIAEKLKISQSAVQQRLQNAGTYALKSALEYFSWLVARLEEHNNNLAVKNDRKK